MTSAFDLPVVTVFLYALLTALATGLGALPLLLLGEVPERWLGLANGVAAGLMGAASWCLIFEGIDHGRGRTIGGMLAGLAFIAMTRKVLEGREPHWGELRGSGALKILLILGVMTIHSVAEGVGIGVAFGGGRELGLYIAAALAVHNIPEGLSISLVMVPRGTSVGKAALWSVFSSLPQPMLAVPAFLFVLLFRSLLPAGLGFAAGAMIWMILAELLPEAYERASAGAVAVVVTLSAAAMLAVQAVL